MPSSAIPRANTTGSGSGCRPASGDAGAASQSSSSTKTAPGRWPRSYSARPGRPSRYQRTSASTTRSRWAAVQAASTTGAIIALQAIAAEAAAPGWLGVVERLQEVVRGQLDLLVAPLRRAVVTGDQAHPVQPPEVPVDEGVAGLRPVGGALGEPEVPERVLVP